MKWMIRAYAFVLLGYTGWRTFDFMQQNLPATDLSFYLALFFLFASEIGLVLWHEIGLRHVTTQEQNSIATAMTGLDFVASLGAGIADMILRQTMLEGYTIPRQLGLALTYGLPLIVAANVLAVILFERADADTQLQKAEDATVFEAHRQAIEDVKRARRGIAQDYKRSIAQRLSERATGRITGEYGNPSQTTPSNNGKSLAKNTQYNAERATQPPFERKEKEQKP